MLRNKKRGVWFILCFLVLCLAGCSSQEVPGKLSRKIDILNSKMENYYRTEINKNPQPQNLKLDFARFYYHNRRFREAQEVLGGLDLREAKVLLAKTYAHLSNYTSALDIFDRMDKLKDPESLYLYGLSLEKKNMFDRAKQVYEIISPGPYYSQAQEKIKSFRNKYGDVFPDYLKTIIKGSPTAEDFPNASSIVLVSEEEIRVTRDNKYVSDVHIIAKVFNDKGRQEWGEIEIGYDSTYERVNLEFARTVTPEGKIIYAGKKNIRDVSKYLNFPLYSNSRAFIVSMPQVLQGSFIEYKVQITTNKLINKNDFSFIYRLQESVPVKKSVFSVSVPQGREIKYKVLNESYLPEGIKINPRIEENKGNKTYVFEFANIPQFIPESNMVSSSRVNPAIVISSFVSWEEFYSWWKKLYSDKMNVSEEMRAVLDELLKGAQTDYQKAQRIHNYCADKIRYVAVEYGQAGFEPHKAAEVFINKYGDCKDQSILLVSLLRAAGLKAYPVLISTKEAYNLNRDMPASYFNHAIACVEIGDGLIFMDPTASTTSFGVLPMGDQNRDTLVFFNDQFKILTTPFTQDNLLKKQMDITISSDEVAYIKRKVIAQGNFASSQRYFLEFTPPYLIEDQLTEQIKVYASLSELLGFQTENVTDLSSIPVLSYSFTGHNFLSQVKELRLLPVLTERVVESSWVDKSFRKYPLYLGSPYAVEHRVYVELPPGLEVKYLPQSVDIKNKWFEVEIDYENKGRTIVLKQDFVTKQEEVGAQEYSEFKKATEEILHSLKQQVILEKR